MTPRLLFLLLQTFIFVPAYAAPCEDCTLKCCAQTALGQVCEPVCQQQCAASGNACAVEAPAPMALQSSARVPLPDRSGGMLLPGWQPIAEQALGDIRTVALQMRPGAVDAPGVVSDSSAAQPVIDGFMQAKSIGPLEAEAQARVDKVIESFWLSATADAPGSERAAERIARAFTFASATAQLSRSVYGAAPGAAAYAAWWAYRQPGATPAQALRVGLLAGAGLWESERGADSSGVSAQVMQRTSLAAALGGVAIAAAGGDEQALRGIFFDTGAAVLLQDGAQVYCLSGKVQCQRPPGRAAVARAGRFAGWEVDHMEPMAAPAGMAFPQTPGPRIAPAPPLTRRQGSLLLDEGWTVNWQVPASLERGVLLPVVVLRRGSEGVPLPGTQRGVAQADPVGPTSSVLSMAQPTAAGPASAASGSAGPDAAASAVPTAPVRVGGDAMPAARVTVASASAASPHTPAPPPAPASAAAPPPASPPAPASAAIPPPAPAPAPAPAAGTSPATARYSCERGGATRSIWTLPGDPKAGYVCRAMYQVANGTQSVLWNAQQNPGICAVKARERVDREESQGFRCQLADAQ